MQVFKLSVGRYLDHPNYERHHRGRNWVAQIVGKNAANSDRAFLGRNGEEWDLSKVAEGDVLEVGGDYITGRGKRVPNRLHWLVLRIDDDEISIASFPSIAQALKAKREGAVLAEFNSKRAAEAASQVKAQRLAAGYVVEERDAGFVALRTIFGEDEDCLDMVFRSPEAAREVFEDSVFHRDIVAFSSLMVRDVHHRLS